MKDPENQNLKWLGFLRLTTTSTSQDETRRRLIGYLGLI